LIHKTLLFQHRKTRKKLILLRVFRFFRCDEIVIIAFKNVKKIYSDFFTNEIREIESGRQVFTVLEPPAGHECGSKTAHPNGVCAAFQPLKGPFFAPERHVFAKKDGPREKKALTFFHADIPF